MALAVAAASVASMAAEDCTGKTHALHKAGLGKQGRLFLLHQPNPPPASGSAGFAGFATWRAYAMRLAVRLAVRCTRCGCLVTVHGTDSAAPHRERKSN